MIAGFVNESGFGNTPIGGIKGFTSLFKSGVDLSLMSKFQNVDAIILWGGADIGTSLYKEAPYNHFQNEHYSHRDLVEWHAMKLAYEKGIPIIGVCRGAQIMCAFAGGKLAQHINGHQSGTHGIVTYDDKQFNDVPSCHHQMMYPYEIEHQVLATVPTNLSQNYYGLKEDERQKFTIDKTLEPEVVYFPDIKGFGIQSHPEWADGTPFVKWCNDQIVKVLYTV